MTTHSVPSEAIIEIFRRAASSPRGIAISFPTSGQAIHFLQRYNTVRAAQVRGDPGSEWRQYTARLDGLRVCIEPLDSHILKLDIEEL